MSELTRRQQQAVETKLRISETAMELFRERGMDLVTIREICEAAAISVGTFYHHFQSKEEILYAAHRQVDLLLSQRIEELQLTDPRAKLEAVILESAKLLQSLGVRFVAGVYQQIINAGDKFTLDPQRYTFQELQSIFTQGKSAGIFSAELDPTAMTVAVMRCSRGVIFDWCLHDGAYDLGALMWADVQLMLQRFMLKV